jgi:DNA invertase Pin-like site-specific DNA recombinase
MNEGSASTLVCWRLDRLGRTTRGLSSLFAELIERNIGFYSLREGIDLSTPAGRLMAHVLASAAQYETELRAERVLAGQAAARAQGQAMGWVEEGPTHRSHPSRSKWYTGWRRRTTRLQV